MSTPEIQKTKAHCSTCGGERNHIVLCSDRSSYSEQGISGGNTYEMLKCAGCGNIKLRDTSWCSEGECDEDGNLIEEISYYPPAVFRTKPKWFYELFLELSIDDQTIYLLLSEIYVALQNDQARLAAMGIRALLEKVMIDKVGDHGSFFANLTEFENQGFVSKIQRKRLDTILDAGHAAMHRVYKPSEEDLITLVDISESLVESIYIHGTKVEKLKKSIPPRPSKIK